MIGFTSRDDEKLVLVREPPLKEMFVLSPFVWSDSEGYRVLVRAVNHARNPEDKIARIYAGRSSDGRCFVMQDSPAIVPGPDEADHDGAEDPTVVVEGGLLHVFYSGWNQTKETSQLMLAVGPDVDHLHKEGITLSSTSEHRDTKEAALIQVPDGTWRLFFEYAAGDHSLVGLARGPSLRGPWTVGEPPFGTRKGKFDSWHLSTGPILRTDPARPVMFYNGADKAGLWRIGWIAFDENLTRVVARSEEPLVDPGPVEAPYRDIAFASSLVVHEDAIWLYYSVADKDVRRATIEHTR